MSEKNKTYGHWQCILNSPIVKVIGTLRLGSGARLLSLHAPHPVRLLGQQPLPLLTDQLLWCLELLHGFGFARAIKY